MKNVFAKLLLSFGLVSLFASPALALAQTVTAPYWCGSYWSSVPCTNTTYSQYPTQNYIYPYPQYSQYPYQYQNYQYQYPSYNYNPNQYNYYSDGYSPYPYAYYNSNYSMSQYPYINTYGSGYSGYCYETVAPDYGQSYKYPCYYPNEYNSNYSTMPY